MEDKAIDVRLPGIPLADLRQAGLQRQGGGVGPNFDPPAPARSLFPV